MLRLSEIEKSFGDKRVLDGISLEVKKGDRVVLSGASGGGKTTLLRIAAGLEREDKGMVEKEGTLAVVFAEARLFPSGTVLRNITAVMKGKGKENEERASALLGLFELSEAAGLYPRELSSGMAARVALARALAFDADIYLLDEPLKSLDGDLKERVIAHLLRFFANKSVLMISHDEAEAEKLATRRLRLADGKLSDI